MTKFSKIETQDEIRDDLLESVAGGFTAIAMTASYNPYATMLPPPSATLRPPVSVPVYTPPVYVPPSH